MQVESIAFAWDEFCEKAGEPDQKIQDHSAATYGGKPASKVSAADVDMATASGNPASHPQQSCCPKTSGHGNQGGS